MLHIIDYFQSSKNPYTIERLNYFAIPEIVYHNQCLIGLICQIKISEFDSKWKINLNLIGSVINIGVNVLVYLFVYCVMGNINISF